MKDGMKQVYFLRHGETTGNVNQTVQGLDDPLTDQGRKQALKIAERATSLSFDILYSSDAVRAKDTAAEISKATGKDVVLDKVFREIKRPTKFEGKSRHDEDFQKFLQEELENVSNDTWQVEDGEHFFTSVARVKRAVEMLESTPEESIMVVTHGHFLRYLTAYLLHQKKLQPQHWLSLGKTMLMSNTGITVWRYEDELWQLLTWNDHAHFAE